jgi:2-aminobenzoate-CoA ligase
MYTHVPHDGGSSNQLPTSHQDTFVIEHLPPRDRWPEFLPIRDPAGHPVLLGEKVNCATALLDEAVEKRGFGENILFQRGAVSNTPALTYREFLAKANQIANFLVKECHLKPGNRVLLQGANTPMLAACWFAVVKAGGICVATLPSSKASELSYVVNKARVHLALTDVTFSEEVLKTQESNALLKDVHIYGASALDSLEVKVAPHSTEFKNVATIATDPVIIAFTSGTTGKPKATVHFHRDVMAICESFPQSTLKAREDDIFTGSPPFAFTFGLGALLLFPMRAGASIALLEGSGPEKLLATIALHRATICFTAPSSYRIMSEKKGPLDISSIRTCVSAGETLPAAVFDTWERATGVKIIDGIGSTEMLHIFISAANDEIKRGATGKPIPGYEAVILRKDGTEAPRGEAGRLAVRGPTGCRYLADSQRQANYVENGWNLTGDIYVQDTDGYFVYCGRSDDLIISQGYNISPTDVEEELLTHPSVAECGVVGLPDGYGSQFVQAFVVLRDPTLACEALESALKDYLKERINRWKIPRKIEFIATLPKGPTGKLQRFRLREGTF